MRKANCTIALSSLLLLYNRKEKSIFTLNDQTRFPDKRNNP